MSVMLGCAVCYIVFCYDHELGVLYDRLAASCFLLLDAFVFMHPYLCDNTCLLYLCVKCVTLRVGLGAVHVHMYCVAVIVEM